MAKRSSSILWALLLVQAVPLIAVVASAFGAFDPLGALAESIVPVPAAGENPGIAIDVSRFVVAYWFFGCLVVMLLGSLAAAVYVCFDNAQTKLQRAAWAVSFLLGQWVTVILYCVLNLLGFSRHARVA